MTETLSSPGILLRENDSSQLILGPKIAGAAIIGPTVKGPVGIPTLITSYSEYVLKFGNIYQNNNTINEYPTSISAYNYFQQGGDSLLVTRVVSGSFLPASSDIMNSDLSSSFSLETLSYGIIMNNSGSEIGNGVLESGSNENIRWEISNRNINTGTFTLLIRRGDDGSNSKTILETWNNLSLDPNSPNYIKSVIGDQKSVFLGDYIDYQGEYTNKSMYVRVSNVNPTLNYLDNNGVPNNNLTGSIPLISSGTFSGALGTLSDNIPDSAYTGSINILSNQDEFRFDILTTPGKTSKSNSLVTSAAISLCSNRGDSLFIVDVTDKGDNILTAASEASEIDTSYAATYYPWLQVNSPSTGKLIWVPPSTIIPSVIIYSDKSEAPWFAPAGFRRGGIPGVVQTERRLSPTDRDILYNGKVNPIGTFPGQGIAVFGQKTLQSKSSALDRINVRRLLIELKKQIGIISSEFIFENNTAANRTRFNSKILPYLDSIQQRQGLYSYSVKIDETNNTSDVIDRNQLVGQIIIQPAKTIEYIILDFGISPTGANFQ
jgi:hypothetical protein